VFKKDAVSADPGNACCGAQMFLDSGDGVVFRGAVGPWYSPTSKQFHLSKEKAKVPVTLKFADMIGEILTAGPIQNDLPPLPFRYYI
ncbi:MAG: hypothetical protein Q8K83_00525, partial [Methylotenera sp.]|nr:hypothetical protein [Methylotenera sp.]